MWWLGGAQSLVGHSALFAREKETTALTGRRYTVSGARHMAGSYRRNSHQT